MIIKNHLNIIDKSRFKKYAITLTVILFFVIFFTQQINTVFAGTGINQQIPYSGSIVNNAGIVLPDSTYRAKFVLWQWDGVTIGVNETQVYEEIRDGITAYPGTGVSPALSVNDGRFDILLGSQNTNLPNIVNNDSLYLEIQLDMDNNGSYEEVFRPRRRMGASLSAINALRLVAASGGSDADTLSLDIAGNVIATSLGGSANSSASGGYDRVLLANSTGQFSQVSVSGSSIWGVLGNATTTAWNGTTGSFLGTTSAQPLVLATTNATAQDIRFFTGANGGNERMRILGNGNVGIGTTGPGAQLTVNLPTQATNTVNSLLITRLQRPQTGGVKWGNSMDMLLGSYGTSINSETRVDFRLANGATDLPDTTVMTLQGNGNVGIGTTAPSRPLTVIGNVQLGTNTSAATATPLNISSGGTFGSNTPGTAGNLKWTLYEDGTAGNQYGIGMSPNLMEFRSGAGAAMAFYTNNGSQAMRILSNGNVGIGNPSPSFSLDVNGNIRAERYRGINSLVLNTYATVNPSSNVFLYSQPNDRDSWIYLDSADTGSNWGIYHRQIDSTVSNLPANSIGFIGGGSSTLQSYISLVNGNAYFAGNVGIGTTSPTARITLGAGTATANTSPLKFTAGTNLTAAEAGAVEWDGTNLFLTTSGAVRQTINQGLTAISTLDFPSTANDSFSTLTVTVTGAALNDVVSLGLPNGSVPAAATDFSAWVSAAGTVTVRFTNNSGIAQDPGSGSFKVFVTKF